MTKDQERINELERALIDVISNLEEDVDAAQWSKHLRLAVYEANKILLNTKKGDQDNA